MKKILLILSLVLLIISCQSAYIASDYQDPFLQKTLVVKEDENFDFSKSVVLLANYQDIKLGDEVSGYIKALLEAEGINVIQFSIDTTADAIEIANAIYQSFELIPEGTNRILLANYLFIPNRKHDHINKLDFKLIDIDKDETILSYRFEGVNNLTLDSFFKGARADIESQFYR